MNLHISLPWNRAVPTRKPVRPSPPDWVNARLDVPPPLPDDGQRACGWFDSSHELHAGLMVTEHPTPQALVDEVPLGWWLDWISAPGEGRVTAAAQ